MSEPPRRRSQNGPRLQELYGEAIKAETRALAGDLAWQEKGALFTISPHPGKAVTQYHLHVRLDDLVPNTTYYYVVGHQGFEATSGEVGSFSTAPTTSTATNDGEGGRPAADVYDARKYEITVQRG